MAALTAADLEQFAEQGFLVVEGILDPQEDLQPVIDEYAALLDDLATRWYAEGKLTTAYGGLPFGQRLTKIVCESGHAYYQYLDISLPQTGVTEATPIHLGQHVFNLLRNPRLLDAAESIVGPEIYSNPVQHVRIKPPERLLPAIQRNVLTVATDWHQDQGVILPEADDSNILTVWLPITDATEENGCLQIVPGSHRRGLQLHCPVSKKKAGVHIPDQLVSQGQAVPVPMKRGSVLFMHRRTMHASLSNRSDDIRWSFDLRYNPIGQPTGRPAFPGFVARSRQHPERVLTDHRLWAAMWRDARSHLARQALPAFNRWSADSPVCA